MSDQSSSPLSRLPKPPRRPPAASPPSTPAPLAPARSLPPPPFCGAAANTRLARRENGRLWIQTVPGPVTLAKNRPSPPNSAVLMPPTYWISKLIVCVNATRQPWSISSVSPGCS